MTKTAIAGILLFILALGLTWLVQAIKADRRRRHIATVVHRDRANKMSRSLRHNIDEPEYPALQRPEHRGQHSPNENSPEFHKILKDLRFTHFWKSEAWRWEETHRQLRKQRSSD